MFDQELRGMLEQEPAQLQSDAPVPLQAAERKASGTYRHQAGAAGATAADITTAESLELPCVSSKLVAPPQPQQSGLLDQELCGLFKQKSAHSQCSQPEGLVAEHAADHKGSGTYWHQSGLFEAAACCVCALSPVEGSSACAAAKPATQTSTRSDAISCVREAS